MNDNALAPIVAVMMILVVVVTLFSVWNAIYFPGLKQQAEVEHLKDVEEGILRFGNDIDNSIYLWRNGTLSESIPLGGGAILLSGVRSGGELRIRQLEGAAVTVSVDGTEYYGHLANISYQPVSNFWIDQGYSWENGAVNVSKGRVSIPITLPDQYTRTRDAFLKNLQQPFEYSSDYRNITIRMVNITPGALNSGTSGNGISRLNLNATVVLLPEINGVSSLTVNGIPPADLVYPANVTIERLDIILSVE